jgi:small subunit ribosomal protein S17
MSVRILKGKVISNKMEKTIVVAVEMPKKHPFYNKIVKNTKKFKARDEIGVNEEDLVVIEECVPLSKTVAWKVTENLSSEK